VTYKIMQMRIHSSSRTCTFLLAQETFDEKGELSIRKEQWVTEQHLKQQKPDLLQTYILEKFPGFLEQLEKPAPPLDPFPQARMDAINHNTPYDSITLRGYYEKDLQDYQARLSKYQRNYMKLTELYDWAVQDKLRNAMQYSTRYMDTAKMFSKITQEEPEDTYEYAFIDSAADTFGVGGKAWVIDSLSDKKVQVAGYHTVDTVKNDIPIGSAITAVDLPNKQTILLRANEATIMGENANSLFSVPQMLENNVDVQDKSRRHGGKSYLECEGIIIPLTMVDAMMTIKIRRPTEHELEECEMIDITSNEPWHPYDLNDEAAQRVYLKKNMTNWLKKSRLETSMSGEYKVYQKTQPNSNLTSCTLARK
jgi:hypothetical protein